MKKSILLSLVSLFVLLASFSASAQQKDPGAAWRDKLQAEKIAFLTNEMDLTPQEAQAFWPVYNQSEKERFKTTEAVFKAFRDLDVALRNGKSGKEISDLLKAYTKASDAASAVDSKYIDEYLKILSSEKVAKLVVGEEHFRQMQIHRLRPNQKSVGDRKEPQTKK